MNTYIVKCNECLESWTYHNRPHAEFQYWYHHDTAHHEDITIGKQNDGDLK